MLVEARLRPSLRFAEMGVLGKMKVAKKTIKNANGRWKAMLSFEFPIKKLFSSKYLVPQWGVG
jgi:hypothetical protein